MKLKFKSMARNKTINQTQNTTVNNSTIVSNAGSDLFNPIKARINSKACIKGLVTDSAEMNVPPSRQSEQTYKFK